VAAHAGGRARRMGEFGAAFEYTYLYPGLQKVV